MNAVRWRGKRHSFLIDQHRAVVRSMGDPLTIAPGEKRKEFVATLVERSETHLRV